MTNGNYKSITKDAFNSVAKEYIERDQLDEADEVWDVRTAWDKFTKLVKPKGKILDLGSGGGRDSRVFYKRGFDVIGVDLAEEMVKGAREIDPNIEYKVMDFENLDFPSEEFDAVWANASLHHIPKANLPSVLKGINKILKDGGIFFIKVKHGDKEGIRENFKFGRNLKRQFSFYRPEELERFLKEAGFTILETELTTKDEWLDIYAKK